MTLRLATLSDVNTFYDMAKEFYNSSPYSGVPVDRVKMLNTIEHLIRDELSVVVFMVNEDDHPVGVIAGTISQMIFSSDKMASEIIWWVSPGYRGRESFKLVEAFEYWAHRSGCKFVQLSLLADQFGDRLAGVYKRRKYVNTEQAYIKEF